MTTPATSLIIKVLLTVITVQSLCAITLWSRLGLGQETLIVLYIAGFTSFMAGIALVVCQRLEDLSYMYMG